MNNIKRDPNRVKKRRRSSGGRSRLTLVNKKTGKVASSNTWLLALAAQAAIEREHSGVLGLLPVAKAEKLLQRNRLVLKKSRGDWETLPTEKAREQATKMIPKLAVLYCDRLPPHRSIRRKDFCEWLVKALKDPLSEASTFADHNGYDELRSANFSARWWHDRLEKMQS